MLQVTFKILLAFIFTSVILKGFIFQINLHNLGSTPSLLWVGHTQYYAYNMPDILQTGWVEQDLLYSQSRFVLTATAGLHRMHILYGFTLH